MNDLTYRFLCTQIIHTHRSYARADHTYTRADHTHAQMKAQTTAMNANSPSSLDLTLFGRNQTTVFAEIQDPNDYKQHIILYTTKERVLMKLVKHH